VIKEFSDKVKTKERLEYLYLLTIADIRGTNPGLYTDWKNTLLKSLYLSSKLYFRKNIFDIKKPDRYVRNLKKSVAVLLNKKVSKKDFEDICSYFNTDYFRRHSDTEIAHHIEFILLNIKGNGVSIKNYETKGYTQLTIYQNIRKNIFTYVANIIDNLNINIVDARIITLKGNRALDTYLLLDQKGEFIKDKYTVEFLKNKISDLLSNPEFKTSIVTKKQTESISTFKNFINIDISQKSNDLLIEINTLDHPGLLSKICESFDNCILMIKDAKIATLGEEANDIFTVFSANKKVLTISDIEEIKHSVKLKILELYN
jgi:[protein-PII] uridylyltransferase